MSRIASPSPVVKSAVALAAEWQRAGWKPGCPPALQKAFAIDRRCYQHFACAGCRGHKQDAQPFHQDQDGYRVLLACPKCGRGEEV